MRVLALDPGYGRLGIAVLERIQGTETLLYSSCMETDKESPIPERLHVIGNMVLRLLKEYKPDFLSVETLFFNKNIKTGIAVAEVRGIILYLAKEHGCTICEYGPQEVKVAVTGYGNSDKDAVILMVKRLVKGAPPKAIDDEYDAIAVGLTCLAHNRSAR